MNILNFMDNYQLDETAPTFEFIELHTRDLEKARQQCKEFFASNDRDFYYTATSRYLVYGGYCYTLKQGRDGNCWLILNNPKDYYEI